LIDSGEKEEHNDVSSVLGGLQQTAGEANFCCRACIHICTVICMHSIPAHTSSQPRT